jgi:hypothetical protein
MGFWSRSLADKNRLATLVSRGLLREGDYLLPGFEEVTDQSEGFVVLFVHLHECVFIISLHPFLVGMLHHYKIQLYHLNFNRV